ncbi:uncharacterized protein N7477_006053 [Penicillium maclennaniae]|uniref:uncharacterized protein n=1 Tax=Penicillium maclennaniae TaxID=1343394 RepID=UPI002541237F|nr:uncharacterized protein N7477_006053 [Penicillium maclennaniae]KAJ5670690.1 hypothetical protein N7477_006053 [Penicillium maclennaniae]
MAYQFFQGRPSGPANSNSPTPIASPPPRPAHPSIHLPRVQPPPAVATRSNQGGQDEYTPYPHAIPVGYATPHPHGGIRCRLEKPNSPQEAQDEATNLYIQTLHLLSPYRGQGVAAALLNALLFETPPKSKSRGRISELVKHYNIRSVTAHVHEANEDGLAWYVARGFKIQDGVVEGYYRRLKPSGARIVRLDLPYDDAQKRPECTEDQKSSTPDDDWEKVEAEDGEEGDHGVQLLGDSQEEKPSRKRKAEEEKEKQPQRR